MNAVITSAPDADTGTTLYTKEYEVDFKVTQKLNNVKGGVWLFMRTHRRVTERHLPYGITQCYLPSDTGKCAPH